MKVKTVHCETKHIDRSNSGMLKAVALFIALCYVFAPLHQQLGDLMHSISHQLESPTYILNHHSTHSDQGYAVHMEHEENMGSDTHEHQIIDFVKELLQASDQKDQLPGQNSTVKAEIDKHFGRITHLLPNTFQSKILQNLFYLKQKSLLGYPSPLEIPPR